MTHVSVDTERCVGHGRCYTLAPKVFDADEVGHAVVRAGEVAGDAEEQAVEAERNCPEGAVLLSR